MKWLMVYFFQPVVWKSTERQKFYLSLVPLELTEGRENHQGSVKGRVEWKGMPRKLKEPENYYSQQWEISFYHYLFILWSYLSTIIRDQCPVAEGSLATFLLRVVSPSNFIWCILNAMPITLQHTNHLPENTREGLYCIFVLWYFIILCNSS